MKALNLLLILHADHEQNCSTSHGAHGRARAGQPLRLIAAGVCALWGPLHGGANQEVLEMLEDIQADGGDARSSSTQAKDKKSGFRLMGFGHRVYKNFDPRAKIIKKAGGQRCSSKLGVKDPLLDIAKQLEEAALTDRYFVERKLYPNVDFYSGIIYRALGFPTDMFTVHVRDRPAPGWIAHWKEMIEDPTTKIGRPRQIYTGPRENHYVPRGQAWLERCSEAVVDHTEAVPSNWETTWFARNGSAACFSSPWRRLAPAAAAAGKGARRRPGEDRARGRRRQEGRSESGLPDGATHREQHPGEGLQLPDGEERRGHRPDAGHAPRGAGPRGPTPATDLQRPRVSIATTPVVIAGT